MGGNEEIESKGIIEDFGYYIDKYIGGVLWLSFKKIWQGTEKRTRQVS